MSTTEITAPVRHEARSVTRWRIEQLLAAGYDGEAAIVLALDLVQERAGHHAAIAAWPAPVRGVVYAVMILFVICWSRGLDQPFIYFQF